MVMVGLQLCEDDELPGWTARVTSQTLAATCAVHALLKVSVAPVAGATYKFIELCCQGSAWASLTLVRDCFYLTRAASAAMLALLQAGHLALARSSPRM